MRNVITLISHRRFVARLVAAITVISSLTACSFLADPEITLSQSTASQGTECTVSSNGDISVSVPSDGGSAVINLTSNKAWTAEVMNTRADSWLSISPESGEKGEVAITVRAAANTTYDERNATVVFRCEELTKSIVVTQKQMNAILLSAGKIEVPAEGKEIEIEVQHNISFGYEIEESCKSWIKAVSTKALTSNKVVFTVAGNQELQNREGTVTFKGEDLVETVKIYQEGAKPAIILSQKEIPVSDKGGEIIVELKSNIDFNYSVTEGAEWLKEVSTKAMSTHTLRFYAQENSSYDQRVAQIQVSSSDGSIKENVTVTQMQRDAIIVANNSYTLESEGGQFTVEVSHNIDYTCTIKGDWIKQITTKGMTTDRLSFAVEKNSSNDSREGSVSFESADGSIMQIVNVYQASSKALVVSDKQKFIPSSGGTVNIEIKHNVDFTVEGPSESWIHEVKTKGMRSTTLTYAVDSNEDYDSRTCRVIITCKELGQTDIVTITQAQKDAIVIAQSKYEIPSKGGDFTIGVGHNVDYTYTVGAEWIKEISTKALTTDYLNFRVEEYKGNEKREAAITFKSADGSLTQTVMVTQSQKDAITISEKEKTVAAKGGTFGLNINSNIKYTYRIISGSSWLHDITTKAVEEKTLYFKVDENTTYDQRTGKITFTSEDGKTKDTVTVTQMQKDAIILAKNSYSYGAEARDITFNVSSNIDYEVECQASWIRQIVTKGLVEKTLSFHIDANTTSSPREGVIRIYGNGMEQKVTINQDDNSKKKNGVLMAMNNYVNSTQKRSIRTINFYTESTRTTATGTKADGEYPIYSEVVGGSTLNFYTKGKEYVIKDGTNLFNGFTSITSLDLSMFNTEQATSMRAMFYECNSLRTINLSSFNTSNVTDMSAMFAGYNSDMKLESVDISNFDFSNVMTISGMFQRCSEIESMSFVGKDLSNVHDVAYLFTMCYKLESLDLTDVDFSGVNSFTYMLYDAGRNRAKFFVTCSTAMKNLLEDNNANPPAYTKWLLTDASGDTYRSTDYSKDGDVTIIQQATMGNGIDLVLMGDAYSDRLINTGAYDRDIRKAVEALFQAEPYKSYRAYFNVYQVTVVSATEEYEGESALGGHFGDGTSAGGNDSAVIDYAERAVSPYDHDNLTIAVIMNKKRYAGTDYMYYPSDYSSDWSSGLSIGYIPISTSDEDFAGTMRHEVGGHGFGKLSDEYYYETQGRIPDSKITSVKEMQGKGWYVNVDFTDNLSQILWAKYISDPRYDGQGIGAYEGGNTYIYGVWRPTDASIMRHNTGIFNAPSREAIYKRINKIAYGSDWTYDHETFVAYDRTVVSASTAAQAKKASAHISPLLPLAPPVVIRHSFDRPDKKTEAKLNFASEN